MQIYLVGGAVRDQLLGLPVKEQDWVVVGATEADMLALGFIKVGKDFPVFLHPKTKEEYALARTERKTSKGYYGFECYAAPDVTLEQDLQRRDITINAMAQDDKGNIIDPFQGQKDLKQRILRHVSPAFSEDPVRILRVARFAARFAELGFHVANETIALMQQMVQEGEVDALVPERVWQEWQRSLHSSQPAIFLEVLNTCHALARLFPEMVNDLNKVLATLSDTALRTSDPRMRFAATLLYASTPGSLYKRLRIPNDYSDLASLVQRYFKDITHANQMPAEEILTLLSTLDAWRRPERFLQVLNTCSTIAPESKTIINFLKHAYEITAAINPAEFIQQGLQGAEIQEALRKRRLEVLK